MLRISILEFIIRGIPEGFLFIFAACVFSKNAIHMKRYLISSILFSVIVYLIRFLPIQNGADTILNLILLITLTVIINKVDIIKAIKASIIALLLGFISEGVNICILQFVLKKDLNQIFNNPTMKIFYGIPSTFIFACIIIIYYFILSKRKELKYDSYGEVDKKYS
jgi:hypothetical protein